MVEACLKVRALSEMTVEGMPRRAANTSKVRTNASDVIDRTTSKCTALTNVQVNRTM